MTARPADDLFLVGDTHQRIYTNQVMLGSLGINIRGRSSKQRARSLLFVAAARARDTVDLFGQGTPSPFLSSSLTDAGER
ncbi:hypothetical protein ACFV27_11455 [Streptomyces antimycoticus]|uniref:UvrD-like helicase C-terminal domain-containing protein n=3 Tax=Streptomyces violaceusniger group TaxID=2839105 RepID=A0ABD5JG78_9ACTN|nr:MULTISPECIES: hypothetical protein [Streptomyces]MEE4586653.1 hypothetical protein [Streptomyces sp. DSM 41602]KUL46600.1 hypothetical protein ADL28_34400 [Streptomyces violaceusniger]MCQ8831693.1 hypothetical protein [Streptomyces samsunensis]QTI91102.1 hypothetical protein AS97_53035 [Streptomyces sp. AgN23]RSS47826.1 hypothetical protein EF902_07900 [Streptomyces sp. WAC05858]